MYLHSSVDIGPRTTIICNPLRHNIMQNNLVRGPSHIGQSPAICDIWFSTTSPEICTPRMPMKAYIEGRPRISRHLHRDMLPDDATGSVYQGLPVHISRDPDSSLVAQNDRAPRAGQSTEGRKDRGAPARKDRGAGNRPREDLPGYRFSQI